MEKKNVGKGSKTRGNRGGKEPKVPPLTRFATFRGTGGSIADKSSTQRRNSLGLLTVSSSSLQSRCTRLSSIIPKRFIYRRISSRRRMRLFLVVSYSLLFAGIMRRILINNRRRFIHETVEKVKAAFKVQCAWRAHQQRKRILQKAAISILVPFLRVRQGRISAERMRATLLLQRVFRSQKERHFAHWMYQNMKYNRAILLIRLFLKRHVAKRERDNLSIQREERRMHEAWYASKALSIIREERLEVLRIQREMSKVANVVLTPMVPRVMIEKEIFNTTGCSVTSHSPLELADRCADEERLSLSATPDGEGHESRVDVSVDNNCASPSAASGDHRAAQQTNTPTNLMKRCTPMEDNVKPNSGEGDKLTWTSILHSEDGARQLLSELFECWLPQYTGCKERNGWGNDMQLKSSPHQKRQPSEQLENDDRQSSGGKGAEHPISSVVSVKPLLGAFIELLSRTESVERKTLEMDILWRHRELLRRSEYTSTIIQSMNITPSLYASLLMSMTNSGAVREAGKLFREEQEKRHKMLEEYMILPLLFLDRPLLHFGANERRKRIKERVKLRRVSPTTSTPQVDMSIFVSQEKSDAWEGGNAAQPLHVGNSGRAIFHESMAVQEKKLGDALKQRHVSQVEPLSPLVIPVAPVPSTKTGYVPGSQAKEQFQGMLGQCTAPNASARYTLPHVSGSVSPQCTDGVSQAVFCEGHESTPATAGKNDTFFPVGLTGSCVGPLFGSPLSSTAGKRNVCSTSRDTLHTISTSSEDEGLRFGEIDNSCIGSIGEECRFSRFPFTLDLQGRSIVDQLSGGNEHSGAFSGSGINGNDHEKQKVLKNEVRFPLLRASRKLRGMPMQLIHQNVKHIPQYQVKVHKNSTSYV
uniref:Uncharacterized protein n=1 Tax=Trypanosoma congolense (strain IL3000) TaxID=1068625 RepID=G0UY77_TRYCI|nr:conserved hypothetical protein [Trypanosoma congolense IL3000]